MTIILRYWPRDRKIPRGWVLAHDLQDCHHGRYSVLIERIR